MISPNVAGGPSKHPSLWSRLGRSLGFGAEEETLSAPSRDLERYELSPELEALIREDDARQPGWRAGKEWRVDNQGRTILSDHQPHRGLEREIRTPSLDLSSHRQATLEADLRLGRLNLVFEDAVFLEARRPGQSWQPLWQRSQGRSNGLGTFSFDLQEYLGSEVEFRFRLTTEKGLNFPLLTIERLSVRADDTVLFRSGRADPEALGDQSASHLTESFRILGDLHEASRLVGEFKDSPESVFHEAVLHYGPDVCPHLSDLSTPPTDIHTFGLLTRVERRLTWIPESRSLVRSWLANSLKGQSELAHHNLTWAAEQLDPAALWTLLEDLAQHDRAVDWSLFPNLVLEYTASGSFSEPSRDLELVAEDGYWMVGDTIVESRDD